MQLILELLTSPFTFLTFVLILALGFWLSPFEIQMDEEEDFH